MIFKVGTKPLTESLNLGVINANVSKFYRRSCVARICATDKELKINLEASRIASEITLKGQGDEAECTPIFVDCLLLKQLVNTFDSSITELEFLENGLVLHSGKAKFTLARENADIDASEISFNAPATVESVSGGIDVNKSNWKYVKDHQLYALAMSFAYAVYTRVWVGSEGDVLVGDFDQSLFTHSKKSNLPNTCLLSDTIINLFNSLPDDSKIYPVDKSYLVSVSTDGFDFRSQFEPEYEDDGEVGDYHSEIILNILTHPEKGYVKVDTAQLSKFLSQAELLSKSTEDKIKVSVTQNELILQDNNVQCKADIHKIFDNIDEYDVEFKMASLKSVLSSYDSETICIAPSITEGEIAGILVWDDNQTTVLAQVDG